MVIDHIGQPQITIYQICEIVIFGRMFQSPNSRNLSLRMPTDPKNLNLGSLTALGRLENMISKNLKGWCDHFSDYVYVW